MQVWTRISICLVVTLNNKTCCHSLSPMFVTVVGRLTRNSESVGLDMPQMCHCLDLVPNWMFSHRPNKIATPTRAGGAAMTLLHNVPDESSRNETVQNVAASVKRMVYPSAPVLARPISSMPARTSSSQSSPCHYLKLKCWLNLNLQDRWLCAKRKLVFFIAPGDAMLACLLETGGIEQRNAALLIGGCFAAATLQNIVHLF